MMALQTQFALTAFTLASRYRRLNMAIEKAFSLSKSNLLEAFHIVIEQKCDHACLSLYCIFRKGHENGQG